MCTNNLCRLALNTGRINPIQTDYCFSHCLFIFLSLSPYIYFSILAIRLNDIHCEHLITDYPYNGKEYKQRKNQRDRSLSKLVAMNRRLESQVSMVSFRKAMCLLCMDAEN